MTQPRPCRVCRKWYHPDRRVGKRQQVCRSRACQQEWHRRNCARWHRENADYDQHTRLVRRLVKDDPPDAWQRKTLDVINWPLAREEIGLQISVLVEETGKVILRMARDEIPA